MIEKSAEELKKERDEFEKELFEAVELIHKKNERIKKLQQVKNELKLIYGDTEIVGELVRCKDCENFVWNSMSQNAGSCGIGIGDGRNHWHSKDWYCANGVKKE